MNAHETLAKVLDNEADKILTKSKASLDSLAGADLEVLETLSRCAKALRVGPPPKAASGDDHPDDVPGLLEKAQR